MRYLVIKYFKQKDGSYNQASTVERTIKPRDINTAMVILDYKDRKIIKLRVDTGAGDRDFGRISNFFKNNGLEDVITKLEDGYEALHAVEKVAAGMAVKTTVED